MTGPFRTPPPDKSEYEKAGTVLMLLALITALTMFAIFWWGGLD